jgi:hypothetical protein
MRGFVGSLFIAVLMGCGAQSAVRTTCSSVKAVPVSGAEIYNDLRDKVLPAGWGGVIDILEDSSKPDSSKRNRCTVHMDYVPVPAGQGPNSANLAFWTADHCLNFLNAQSVELNLFDPVAMKYVRFGISIKNMEQYKTGLKLFTDRQVLDPGDATANADLATFRASALRESVSLNSAPLIERGVPICQADTDAYKTANPGLTAICSTVLDLARVDAVATAESLSKPEVLALLNQLSAAMKKQEDEKFAMVAALEASINPAITDTMKTNFKFFVERWRGAISDMTRWRGYEGQAALIEKVRLCDASSASGICAQQFRDFFKKPLEEYAVWTAGVTGTAKTFQQALHDEVYADMDTAGTKRNLKWLLFSQSTVANNAAIAGQSYLSTNFLRPGLSLELSANLPTLGDSGPLYYGLASPAKMLATQQSSLPTTTATDPLSHLVFKPATILVPHTANSAFKNSFFLQPGDSGSVLHIANTPIGVIATVDGNPTSGGASVMPLPEYTEESTSTSTQANTQGPSKSTAQTGCRQ